MMISYILRGEWSIYGLWSWKLSQDSTEKMRDFVDARYLQFSTGHLHVKFKNEGMQTIKSMIRSCVQQMKQLRHDLYLGDCNKIMDLLKESSVDVILVDPPYNTANKNTKILKGRKELSKDFGSWDYFGDSQYLEFTKDWITRAVKVLKESGNFLVFCKLEYVSDIRRIYERLGLVHHATIIWHKTNPAPQIRKTGFLSSCEAILWSVKGFDAKKVPYTFNFKKQNEMHNFIETPICMGHERTAHPTQKPEKLIKHLVEIFSNSGDVILDGFAGSGTTSAVAMKLGRNSISVESNQEYFEIMKQRLHIYEQSLSHQKVRVVKSSI